MNELTKGYFDKPIYSFSCDLSTAPAPNDSDRHRTSPNLLGPAPFCAGPY